MRGIENKRRGRGRKREEGEREKRKREREKREKERTINDPIPQIFFHPLIPSSCETLFIIHHVIDPICLFFSPHPSFFLLSVFLYFSLSSNTECGRTYARTSKIVGGEDVKYGEVSIEEMA